LSLWTIHEIPNHLSIDPQEAELAGADTGRRGNGATRTQLDLRRELSGGNPIFFEILAPMDTFDIALWVKHLYRFGIHPLNSSYIVKNLANKFLRRSGRCLYVV
jgi:hypothetical protein